MNRVMKWAIAGAVLGCLGAYLKECSSEPMQFFNFATSPSNFDNSGRNFDNSPSNWLNSPANFDNNPLNKMSTNGIYDTNGNRIGYTTVNPQGVTNVYSNNGERLGYIPAPDTYAPVRIGK